MTQLELAQLLSVACSPLFAAGGAYAAVRVRLRALEERTRELADDLKTVHRRIDRIIGGPRAP